MTRIEVATSGDETIIRQYETNGYTLAAIHDHVDGHFLVFLDPGEEPETPTPEVDPIEDLKAQVADLKQQLDTVKADLSTTKTTAEKNAVDIASIKTEAVKAVKG